MRYAKATDDFYVPEARRRAHAGRKARGVHLRTGRPEIAEQTREELRTVYDAAFAAYERLVEARVAREARPLRHAGRRLPSSAWTINARSLMNFVSLRAAETAQRDPRYAEAIEQFFAEQMPVTRRSLRTTAPRRKGSTSSQDLRLRRSLAPSRSTRPSCL
jgi:thymidylate synthase (FAD)